MDSMVAVLAIHSRIVFSALGMVTLCWKASPMKEAKGSKYFPDLNELREIIEKEKMNGRTVVFANGCFDLLHVGHIRYLEAAKAEGDVLVVAVNDDESTRIRKGPDFPIMPLAERIEILNALSCVDYITSFSDPTVDRLLDILRPHVHAKGTDYTVENVPERQTALKIGARIAIVGDPKSHSSSALVSRCKMIGSRGH